MEEQCERVVAAARAMAAGSDLPLRERARHWRLLTAGLSTAEVAQAQALERAWYDAEVAEVGNLC